MTRREVEALVLAVIKETRVVVVSTGVHLVPPKPQGDLLGCGACYSGNYSPDCPTHGRDRPGQGIARPASLTDIEAEIRGILNRFTRDDPVPEILAIIRRVADAAVQRYASRQ